MSGKSSYLNTDLDLTSAVDLSALAAVFESRGVFSLHVTREANGIWNATFETSITYAEPEPNIAAMTAVAESLDEPLRAIWQGCTRRQFDIGYDCGAEPGGLSNALSCELLSRLAAIGASLRITLYPDRE